MYLIIWAIMYTGKVKLIFFLSLHTQVDENGNAGTHLAAINADVDMFRFLIEIGLDPEGVNNDGYMSFDMADTDDLFYKLESVDLG